MNQATQHQAIKGNRTMKRPKQNRPGFTLVEMLVVVALVLFLMGLFVTLLQTATRGVRDAKGINAIDQKMRNAITAIKADLRQVYLENNGTRFSPGELFTRADRIPTGGYFTIEENDRALAQGIDEFGNKIEIDFDDILRMTVARRGDSASEMFYGRAAAGYSTCTVNGVAVDVGTYLDNLWRGPASRFDVPGNQLVTSRFAEVVYFVRAQGSTPTLGEIHADPLVFGTAGVSDLSQTPKLFNLYRRQLLVLNDESLNRPPVSGRGVGPVLIPAGASPYNFFDVSMTRELAVDGSGNLQLATQGGQTAIHFNTLSDLSRREFRYGMQPILVALTQPFNAEPYVGSASSIYNRTRTLRAYPLSHVDSTAANANPLPILHDYYRGRNPNTRDIPTTPANTGASLLETWIGAPTLMESSHPNYPFWLPPGVDVTASPVNLTVDASTGELTNYPVTGGQRSGDDILLRDVVSWDIKVLEDLGGYRGDDPTGAGDALATQAAGALDNSQFHDMTAYGYTAPPGDAMLAGIMQRRMQFVDLGYGQDETLNTRPAGGDDTVAAGVNVLTVANYLFQTVPPPTQPPSFTINGVTYTYTPPAYGLGNLNLAGPPFGFAWPPTTPQSLAFPSAPTDRLLRGAYSPRSSPFGVPLDVKFWVRGSTQDLDHQSDVYFGPDGKPGIGFFADQAPHTGTPDAGILETPTGPAPGGEYQAPRSDDLIIDPTFAPANGSIAANYAFWSRPGVGGPDMALGERGYFDDGVGPAIASDNRDKLYPTAAGTQFSLGELFAVGTDDVPFVGVPFKLSGQVAAINATVGAKHHPFNLYNLNPRNAYDSWSATGDLVNEYTGQVVLPSYKASPVRQHQVYGFTKAPPTGADPPTQALEQSYIPEPDFRPVPYARPLKGVQIKVRVLERRTGIVREATIRHFFGPTTE
jgi:prepilin-type N-terminal cleavage/methylation domain-containing protein